MSLIERLRRLLVPGTPVKDRDVAELEEEFAWMFPPKDMHDSLAWDLHWKGQLEHGVGPQFCDMFCRDTELVELMRRHDLQRVLCAGNGISQEPKALKAAGFTVTALDLSGFATFVAEDIDFDAEYFNMFMDPKLKTDGGSLTYAVGNLMDTDFCEGPFDVVLERRTIQNFSEDERPKAMEALAGRLAPAGLFVSHCHDGGWKPPAEPRHVTSKWFRQHEWPEYKNEAEGPLKGRFAYLVTSTG